MGAVPQGEFQLPLFPLPNVVFFPQTRLPLHIFEPRYRRMVQDALEGDRRIGMVLLKPGWETDYYGAPSVHPVGTMGYIEHAITLDDGRYNILLRGDVRFRIEAEISKMPYRVARAVSRPETGGAPEEALMHREWLADLSQQYLTYLPDQMAVPELATAALEPLTNALVMSLNLDPGERQKLLEVDSLIERADLVGAELAARIENLRFLGPFRRDGDPSKN